jgi:DNA-binding NarL/FixJ family response regulator
MTASGNGAAVLVLGRNDLMRRGLSSIVERGGLRVVAECATPSAGMQVLKRETADVAVLDAEAGDASASNLAALAAACPLLVLVPDGDLNAALGALQSGARGCVSRSSPAHVLLAQIQVAANGATVISGATALELFRSIHAEAAMARNGASERDETILDRLTSREIEVLELVANGWDNAHIGAALFISPRTVKNHIASILEKLGLDNRIQAAVCAVRSGLTDGDGWGARRPARLAGSAPGSHNVA